MIQLAAVIISFMMIPVLGRLKIKLSYTLFISSIMLGLISGIGFKGTLGTLLSVFIKQSSLNTILTVLMVSILGGLMKHYKILDKIVAAILLVVPDKRIILMIIPALVGVLIIPGGALLSVPFIYNLGEEMNIPKPRRAAINLVFRHIAMFVMPYSTGLLVISASIPGISILRLVLLNMFYVVPMIVVGYYFYIRDIKSEKITVSRHNLGKNILNIALYTMPFYICVILNAITGWPFYLTMLSSIISVYFLSNKKNFVKTTINSINWHTVLIIVAILIIKETILKMNDLLFIFNSMFNVNSTMISNMLIFLTASVFFGIVTGNQAAALAIILPMVAQLQVSEEMLYIYLYFSFSCAFIGYFFSPIHLCQAFTVQHMNTTTIELLKQYKYFIPTMLLALFSSVFIMRIIFI